MKKLVWVLGVAILIFLVYAFALEPDGPDTAVKVDFKTTDVQEGKFTLKISAKGVVEARFQVEVKSKASGEVLRFPFEEGDRVKKGQLLIELDKSDETRNVAKARADGASAKAKLDKSKAALTLQKTRFETDKRSARSEVDSAEASLKEATDKLKRQRDLFGQQFTSKEALDTAETQFKVETEKLTQARARMQAAEDAFYDIAIKENDVALAKAEERRVQITLDEAVERLQETEIFAPLSGVLIEKLVQQGQIIASGISNVSGGTALATLADVSRLYILADVDETDIGQVKTGQRVSITADAYPNNSYKGKVERIAPKGLVESSITVFKVKIEILGKGKTDLKPMMSANTDILIEELEHALYLSRAGVRQGEDGPYAMILENDEPRKVPVEIGLKSPIHAQILSGVEAGQKVIVGDWEKAIEEAKKSGKKGSALRKILWMIRSK